MKANNLTISIPCGFCKYNCPYCVSNMTYSVTEDPELFRNNLHKVRLLSERLGITHILITAKAEPTQNYSELLNVVKEFKDFPLEIQTNFSAELIKYHYYFNVVAISIDHPIQFKPKHWIDHNDRNYITRAAVMLTNKFDGWRLMAFIDECKKLGIQQLTIRQPTIPKTIMTSEKSINTAKWIKDNSMPSAYKLIIQDLQELIHDKKAKKVRDLMFGSTVYDIDGIGFTYMEYCVESQNGEHMRSLIYQADGHLYTTWDARGSILF